MTEIAAPVPAALPLARVAEAPTPTPTATGSAPARASRLRRLASAVMDTHRAAVPF